MTGEKKFKLNQRTAWESITNITCIKIDTAISVYDKKTMILQSQKLKFIVTQ